MKKNIHVNPTYRRNKIWSKLTAFPQITLLHFSVALNLSFSRKSASLEQAGSFLFTESNLTWLTKADTVCHSNEWLIRLGNSEKIPFSKIQFLTFTLNPNLLHTGLVEAALRARCNKTWQKKRNFGGKGWYLPTSGSILYKRQYKISAFLCF